MAAFFNPAEDEINFNSFTKFPLFLFRLLFFGFKPASEIASLSTRIAYSLRMCYFKFIIVCLVVAIASMIGYAIVNSDNFVAAATSVPNVVTVVLIGLKSLATLLRKDQIWQIFLELSAIFELHAGENKKYKIKNYLSSYHRLVKTYSGTFVLMFMPIAVPFFDYLATGRMKISVNYYFPYDAYQAETFLWTLLIVIWIAFYTLVLLLATDSLLYSLTTVVAMEFDILKVDFMNLNLMPKHRRADQIRSLTDRHNKLFDLGDKLQEIYALTFLFSFVISSLIMCFVAFQLSIASGDISAYSFYIPYLCMIGGQILLLSVFGQKLKDSSEAVADGIYDCGWEEFKDNAFKRQLVIVMLRAQKPKRLTAMNFAEISLQTFTTVSLS